MLVTVAKLPNTIETQCTLSKPFAAFMIDSLYNMSDTLLVD